MTALVASLGVTLASMGPTAAEPSTTGVIVVFVPGTDGPAAAAEHASSFGVVLGHVYTHALEGYSTRVSTAQRNAIVADPRVAFVTGNGKQPTPRPIGLSLHRAGTQIPQFVAYGLERVGADTSSAVSGDGKGRIRVNVAVLDGGIQGDHPDLNVAGGTNCLSPDTDDYADQDGHGTFVAGLIGALDNKFGVVGVAPGANIYAVRVANPDGYVSHADLLCGMDWVAATRTDKDQGNDIAVANLSLGGPEVDDGNCGYDVANAEHVAICGLVDAGVVPVTSAGNESTSLRRVGPAGFDEVLAVTAMADGDGVPGGLSGPLWCLPEQDADDEYAFFSNYADQPEDADQVIAAPGVCVPSTWFGSRYGSSSGTSFASPIAAGTVALCIAAGPCDSGDPAVTIARVLADTKAYNEANPDYGYVGDPFRPVANRYYGYLIHAGNY